MKSMIQWMFLTAATVAQPALANSIQLSPNATVDAEQARVFIAAPDATLQSYSLDGAERLWISELRGRPLALVGDRLIALAVPTQVGTLRIQLLDADSGVAVSAIEVPLAPEVRAEVAPQPGQSFSLRAEPFGAHGLRLYWRFEASPLRGAKLDEQDDERIEREGALELTALDSKQPKARALAQFQAPAAFVPLLGDLERISVNSERQFRALDDQSVLSSREVGDPVYGVRYEWRLFERSGESLGKATLAYPYAAHLVRDGRLLAHVMPQVGRKSDGSVEQFAERIVSFDLGRSRELWQIALLSSVYQGVMPP